MIRVFYIDDEPILLLLAKRFLEMEADIELTTFDRAQKALDEIDTGNIPDLLISDIKMPIKTGFDLARELIDGNYLTSMRFAYCTSFASLEGASDVYGVERKDLLSFPIYKKPINKALGVFIRELMNGKEE